MKPRKPEPFAPVITWLYNIANLVTGRVSRLRYDRTRNLYFIDDGKDRLFIAHPKRNWRYKRGIAKTVEKLATNYQLHKVALEPGDVFIDCGANAGELGVWARQNNLAYHAFEPDPNAAIVCDLNAFDGKENTNRECLWYENTTLKFYEKTDTADSSVFEIEKYDNFHEVPAVSLDHYCAENKIGKIRLLKVEAEGAEPEVLKGANGIMKDVDFIAVDCSYERGKTQEHTLVDVENMLVDAGFRLVAARMKVRCTFLFENSNTRVAS